MRKRWASSQELVKTFIIIIKIIIIGCFSLRFWLHEDHYRRRDRRRRHHIHNLQSDGQIIISEITNIIVIETVLLLGWSDESIVAERRWRFRRRSEFLAHRIKCSFNEPAPALKWSSQYSLSSSSSSSSTQSNNDDDQRDHHHHQRRNDPQWSAMMVIRWLDFGYVQFRIFSNCSCCQDGPTHLLSRHGFWLIGD